MKATLIASTCVFLDPMYKAGFNPTNTIDDPDILGEFAGRACYQSWDKPNPATATNEGYLNNILDHRHFSVLEHASATFYITGVSRALTHELVRHRHFSFSQLSQRFVDSSTAKCVFPPGATDSEKSHIIYAFGQALVEYDKIYTCRKACGATRKEARQAARAVLPNSIETKIVVTGNIRAWREFIEKRYTPDADREIYELAREILVQLKDLAPNTFQDMEVTDG